MSVTTGLPTVHSNTGSLLWNISSDNVTDTPNVSPFSGFPFWGVSADDVGSANASFTTGPPPSGDGSSANASSWAMPPRELHYYHVTFLSLAIVLGVPGNTAVVAAYGAIRLKTSCDWYILYIAVLDLIICLIRVPTHLAMETGYWKGRGSDALCKFIYWLSQAVITASVILFGFIAIDRTFSMRTSREAVYPLHRGQQFMETDGEANTTSSTLRSEHILLRYLKVCRRFSVRITTRFSRNSILVISFFSLASALPAWWMYMDAPSGKCVVQQTLLGITIMRSYYTVVFVCFIGMFAIVVVCYSFIVFEVKRSQGVLKRHETLETPSVVTHSDAPRKRARKVIGHRARVDVADKDEESESDVLSEMTRYGRTGSWTVNNNKGAAQDTSYAVNNNKGAAQDTSCAVNNNKGAAQDTSYAVNNNKGAAQDTSYAVNNNKGAAQDTSYAVNNNKGAAQDTSCAVNNNKGAAQDTSYAVNNNKGAAQDTSYAVNNNKGAAQDTSYAVNNNKGAAQDTSCAVNNNKGAAQDTSCAVNNNKGAAQDTSCAVNNNKGAAQDTSYAVNNNKGAAQDTSYAVSNNNKGAAQDTSYAVNNNTGAAQDTSYAVNNNKGAAQDTSYAINNSKEAAQDTSYTVNIRASVSWQLRNPKNNLSHDHHDRVVESPSRQNVTLLSVKSVNASSSHCRLVPRPPTTTGGDLRETPWSPGACAAGLPEACLAEVAPDLQSRTSGGKGDYPLLLPAPVGHDIEQRTRGDLNPAFCLDGQHEFPLLDIICLQESLVGKSKDADNSSNDVGTLVDGSTTTTEQQPHSSDNCKTRQTVKQSDDSITSLSKPDDRTYQFGSKEKKEPTTDTGYSTTALTNKWLGSSDKDEENCCVGNVATAKIRDHKSERKEDSAEESEPGADVQTTCCDGLGDIKEENTTPPTTKGVQASSKVIPSAIHGMPYPNEIHANSKLIPSAIHGCQPPNSVYANSKVLPSAVQGCQPPKGFQANSKVLPSAVQDTQPPEGNPASLTKYSNNTSPLGSRDTPAVSSSNALTTPALVSSARTLSTVRGSQNFRLTMLLLLVTAVFVVSWIPPYVAMVWYFYVGYTPPLSSADLALQMYAPTGYVLNHFANPFIYLAFSPAFRHTLMALWRKVVRKLCSAAHT